MFRSEILWFTKMEESIVGDPIGLKAIQSIMQTATQSNLSFFHKAGTMSKSLSPSVQQLLDVSKSPTCRMFIKLRSKISSKDIVYLRIIKIVESFSLAQPGEEEFWIQLGAAMNLFELNRDFPYQLDIQFDVKQLIKKNISLIDIVNKISTITSMYNKTIVYSPNILGIIRIYCDEHQSMIKIVDKLHLGIEGIHDAAFHDDLTIVTNGSNLSEVFKLAEVDIQQTYSNHLLQMEEKFGIEAARSILYDEILLKNNNKKYASIIADYMCVSGVLRPFSKDGTMIRNPILSMGYEEASSDLKKMHTNTIVDPLRNSYSRMSLALPMDQGFEIIPSEDEPSDV
jgi:DNA-directed RNA polymerase beta' subunit